MDKTDKKIAFDLGNVLFSFDYTIALNKIKDRMKASIPEVIYSLYDKNFTIPFEKGLVSPEQFYEDFMKEFGIRLAYSEFVDVWCKIFFPIPEVFGLVTILRKRYSLYLISNINQLHFEYLYNQYPDFFAQFKDLILSYKVKSVKPELEIYQALKRAADVSFSEIIYIDDRQDLIAEARKFKLNCIRYQDYNQLSKDLGNLGLDLDFS